MDITDIMATISMPDKDFIKLEKKIEDYVGDTWKFYTDIAKDLNISKTMVKGISKRSTKLDVKGHKIGKIEPL